MIIVGKISFCHTRIQISVYLFDKNVTSLTETWMHMRDDRLNLGRLSKMDLDEISGINVLVNGNKFMWYLS